MHVLNFRVRFNVGTLIEVKKPYTNGIVSLLIGDRGIVQKVSVESFPDLGLFNLRIIYMAFGKKEVGMEEKMAREYFAAI